MKGKTLMNMYEELDRETHEMLLQTLAERTLAGKQQWEELDYSPISFIRDTDDYDGQEADRRQEAYVSQAFEMETDFNGRRYQLELMEQIDFPSEKGNISGTLTYDGDKWGKYDFALSYACRKYDDSSAEQLKEIFADSPILKLAEAVISVFEGTEAKEFGFSYAGYYNQEIEMKWKQMPLVRLGKKLMDEKRMADFHRIILDMEYRKKLLEEV